MIRRCKKHSIPWFAIMALLWLAACGQDPTSAAPDTGEAVGQTPVTQASPAATSEPREVEPLEAPQTVEAGMPVINPLTGQAVEASGRLAQRPILIKVTLYPRNNRPQWGLSFADLVFEHYTEGGLSRFSALYYGGESEIVGPIRSARLIDIQLVRMYEALFAYGSADQRVLEQIDASEFAERAVREFPAGCPPLCRLDPTGQNHLTTGTRALRDFYTGRGVDLQAPALGGMTFEAAAPAGEEHAVQVDITYSTDSFHMWRYSPAEGLYMRSQESGEGAGRLLPLTDRITGEQIQTPNVVVLKVPHELYIRSPEVVDIQLYGEGEGVAFRDGLAYAVRWIRPYPAGVLYLIFPDGSPYPFKPGTTWFELVGTSSRIEQLGDGRWSIAFDQP